MKLRHRTPSIFSLSMVDMLCCALGCVIFLWILNFWQARDRTAKAGQVEEQLTSARGRLTLAEKDLEALRALAQLLAQERQRQDMDLAEALQRLALTEKERETLRLLARNAEKDRDRLAKDILGLQATIASAEDRLTKRGAEQTALSKELAALTQLLRAADAELSRRRMELDASEKQLASLQAQAKEKDLLAKTTARNADDIRGQLRDSEAQVASLTKALAEQRVQADKATQARIAAENRFAGVVMSGRRVVFLVDISGSMELLDGVTPAPDKWAGVCDALRRVIQSLPDLEKFQVILFSNDVSYPLGSDGRWIDYDPKTSGERALQAALAVRPKGNTNMYAAFDAAFRLRAEGLDTIYVLSDGLPNMGPGLPADGGKGLNDTDRASLLAQHVRRTLRTNWNRPIGTRPPVRINAIGFFYESPDVGAFLWALARENDGSFVGMSKP